MKKLIAMLLSLAMVFSLVACGQTETPSDTPETPNVEDLNPSVEGDAGFVEDVEAAKTDYVHPIVHMVEKNDFLTIDPFMNSAPTATYEMYEYLFCFSQYDGEWGPVLCDVSKGNCGGYTHEAGTGVYTFHLYDYITDHLGNNVTASDVVFSFDHYLASNKVNGSGIRKLVGYEATGDYDVTFTFTEELTGLRELETVIVASPIVSEKSFNELGGNLTTTECGTGPYILKEFTSGSSTVVEAYDNYWQTNDDVKVLRQLQNVKEINYAYLPDASQQIIAMQSGEIDLIQDASADFVDMFRDGGQYDEGFNVISYLQSGCLRVGVNHTKPDSPFFKRTMRLALFYAIDNNAFVTAMGGEKYGVITPAPWGVGQPDFQKSWYDLENFNTVCDPELSKQYMADAGYNGEELVLLAESNLSNEAQLLENMLEQAGFNITLELVDSTTNRTRTEAGEYDIMIGNMAGYCGADMIQKNLSYKYELDDGTKVGSNFENDAAWLDLADVLSSAEGHTPENAQAWIDANIEGAHVMGLTSTWINLIVNESIVSVCRTDKNKMIPGGFTYADPNA